MMVKSIAREDRWAWRVGVAYRWGGPYICTYLFGSGNRYYIERSIKVKCHLGSGHFNVSRFGNYPPRLVACTKNYKNVINHCTVLCACLKWKKDLEKPHYFVEILTRLGVLGGAGCTAPAIKIACRYFLCYGTRQFT